MATDDKKLRFDLISDAHCDQWDEKLTWKKSEDSDIIIVAGDLSDSVELVKEELERLAAAYKTVLYIDGNHEYYDAYIEENRKYYSESGKDPSPDINVTQDRLRLAIADLPNVHYLKDSVYIKDGVAIVGRNGFWDHQFADGLTVEESEEKLAKVWGVTPEEIHIYTEEAKKDFEDLQKEIQRLNDDPSIHSIVVVTHTVPHEKLIFPKLKSKRPDIVGYMGNSQMQKILDDDKNKKIKYWLFGHFHVPQDQQVDNVHFISHPRGMPKWGMKDYKPMELQLETNPPPVLNPNPGIAPKSSNTPPHP